MSVLQIRFCFVFCVLLIRIILIRGQRKCTIFLFWELAYLNKHNGFQLYPFLQRQDFFLFMAE